MGVIRANNPWGLTLREQQVLDALVLRGSTRAAAEDLCMKLCTVQTYIERAMQKMNVRHRIQLVLEWDRWVMGRDGT